jgi:nitrogen fixation NifU-like protein
MTSELDQFADELELQLWAGYSETAIDHAQNPRNVGKLPNADGYASVTGPCGDTMQIWLKIREGTITKAVFWTDGCGATIVAGSMITELAKAKSISQSLKITQQKVLDALGGLPEDSIHCALLAANTLKGAIKDYLSFRNEPWKRAYERS